MVPHGGLLEAPGGGQESSLLDSGLLVARCLLLVVAGEGGLLAKVAAGGAEAGAGGELRLLVGDLAGVDGVAHDALGEVLLGALDVGDGDLAVDDGVDFVYDVGADGVLDEGRSLDDASHVRGGGLLDVLLNMMHHSSVYFTMDDRLHFNDSVTADGFLDDWGSYYRVLLIRPLLSSCEGTNLSAVGEALGLLVAVAVAELVQESGHVERRMNNKGDNLGDKK